MNTKLTLKLDQEVIERTKRYAERRGVSLSEMVESYFMGITGKEAVRPAPGGPVAELAGLLRGMKIEEPEQGYADYLAAKYS
jgi:hypothetical protein